MEAMVEVGSSNGTGLAGDHDHDRDHDDDQAGTPKTACVEDIAWHRVCKITNQNDWYIIGTWIDC